jgi:hypothetical protein
VYGLKRPGTDRQSLIFAVMNGSLVLNIISYVAVLTTGNLAWGVGLEIAYSLMPVWAVLLAIQLGVFSEPTQPWATPDASCFKSRPISTPNWPICPWG